MDEVPIVSANPVNLIIRKQEVAPKPTRKDRIKESLKNFFMMLPLALVVMLQFFFLGKSFGNFSTFPLTTYSTYILLGSIILVMMTAQLLMRSIIYSTLTGAALTMGLFSAWFGDFYTPMTENMRSITLIVKSAWSHKDIPFNLLVTGSMTAIIAGITFVQFFVSLLVKSFFELLFGKEWGDGRVIGYAGAIALLIGIQFGFYSYASISSDTSEKLIWEKTSVYSPVEKFVTRTPGNFTLGAEHLWIEKEDEIAALDIKTGKSINRQNFKPGVIHKGFQTSTMPVFCAKDGFYGFTSNMSANIWKTSYPASFPNLEISEESKELFNNSPLTTRFIESGRKLLAFFDYGYAGMYKTEDGSLIWLKQIDLQIRTNRLFPEAFLDNGLFLEAGDKIIISCHNALVRCLNRDTGEQLWQYQHGTPKISGRSQKAYLSLSEDRLVAAFKSGEIATLALADGRKIYQAANQAFNTCGPAYFKDLHASILTEEGIFHKLELDGGKILYSANVLPRRLDLVPVVYDLSHGIVAHRDEIMKLDDENKNVSVIFSSKNRVFATRPVFDDKIMYIGTQDGWIYCIHYGSKHEKWCIHVNGELEEDSLCIVEDSLLVKTRSGSIYRFKRDF
ncbi:MAG: PQQ-binding-like beta-propeller repeat protein [Candidatus Riflebacteria bacterium]|nr:PQQ-binding-like beta-propeller repeat protein [Candidatus Riflebacteria bacterium]